MDHACHSSPQSHQWIKISSFGFFINILLFFFRYFLVGVVGALRSRQCVFEVGSCLCVVIWIWNLASLLWSLCDVSLCDVGVLEVQEMFKMDFTVHQPPQWIKHRRLAFLVGLWLFKSCRGVWDVVYYLAVVILVLAIEFWGWFEAS